MVPDVHDFYRLFLAAGVEHCSGGSGGHPSTVLDALVGWVENGTAPDTLFLPIPAETRYRPRRQGVKQKIAGRFL